MMAYGGRDDRLFRAGILESGGAFPLTSANTSSFQDTFDGLITNTSCSSFADAPPTEQLDCIRKLPIKTLLSSVGPNTGQSIDGSFTQTSIHFALQAEKYVKVPTIVGSTYPIPPLKRHPSPNSIRQQTQTKEPTQPQRE